MKRLMVFMLFLVFAVLFSLPVLADTPGASLMLGSHPERVEVSWEGSFVAGQAKLLTVKVYDRSAIAATLYSGTLTVRIMTVQVEPEGWGRVLAVGRAATTSKNSSGYTESCYVAVSHTEGDLWEGSLSIVPSASLREIYVCLMGSCEETMILGLSIREVGSFTLQTANPSPPSEIVVRTSSELEDNRIGSMSFVLWHPEYDPEVFPISRLETSLITGLGLKSFRLSINDLPPRTDWSMPELQIDPRHNDFIVSLTDNGLDVTYVLHFWDKAWVAQGNELPTPRFREDGEIQRYLDYVRFVVRHYKGRIQYYEIWNEPNIRGTIMWMKVGDYLRIARDATSIIRQEDPHAKIVVGGTSNLAEQDSQEYLFAILESDLMKEVDVVSWHGMYGPSPEFEYSRDYYYDYASLVREIKETAAAHGFVGEYVADELKWQTPDLQDPNEPWPNIYSEIQCAKYYARGIVMNLGLDASVSLILLHAKSLWSDAMRNLSTIMAGHEAIDMPAEIDIETEIPVAYCAFRYPNGDRILAVWTDGIAQDEDPGVMATITFPGLATASVTGIDVLHGFEQELVFEISGEGTIIRDLLVKDYPTFIRL
ncbi:hypothetical protein IH601_01970, partial [Candidatus Bipolaricaulota bacterium]|nr:hypothetical protein [Candidatus Bipolaricaulota bacterium]